ncbi:MAG: hypothetical protein ABI954_08795, partial [Pyrinomonadaceae bacterium]
MTTRSAFSLDEWQKIRQSPFWLWQLLCAETESSIAKQTADVLLSEISEPRFFPPLVRVAFRSALEETPAPFTVSPQPNDWQTALSALRERATAEETAQFQMSLASLGRTLIKCFGSNLVNGAGVTASDAPYFSLDKMWRELGFQSYHTGLQQKDFTAQEWQQLQLAPMQVWMHMSMIDGAISPAESNVLKNLITETFPPYTYFVLTETIQNLDALFQTAQARHTELLEDLSEITELIEKKLSPENTAIYKMSLLMLAHDVTDVNAQSVAESIVPKNSENYLNAIQQICETLKLNKPRKTQNEVSFMPETSPNKENIVMMNSEPTVPGTVADAIAAMEAEESAAAEPAESAADVQLLSTETAPESEPAAETKIDETAADVFSETSVAAETTSQEETSEGET